MPVFPLIAASGLLLLGAAVFLLRSGVLTMGTGATSSRRSLRAVSDELRTFNDFDSEVADIFETAHSRYSQSSEDEDKRKIHGVSFQTKLRYARLQSFPPYVYSLAQIVISLSAFLLARMFFKAPLQIAALFAGPILINWIITKRINQRVKEFDLDFPQFLLSVVGMLKTGLNTTQALQAAADNLDDTSLVKQEVELMLERVRVGVPEDRSIGSFAEDVFHPEVELFVQALILSKRVGGTLSETLDRLAKQVRKRQQFKMSAGAAVSMHRGSIWFILLLIAGLNFYIYKSSPEMVVGVWANPSLTAYAQFALCLMLGGVWWMNKLTDFKV